jgi:hypothetical protein
VSEELETTAEVVARAERLVMSALGRARGEAGREPRPTRRGGGAASVVEVLRQLPGIRPDLGTQHCLEAIAWLSCALAETALTEDDFRREGIPDHVVVGARALCRAPWMTTMFYYREIDRSFELVKIVKVCERIAMLRAGRPQDGRFAPGKGYGSRQWWMTNTHEAKHFDAALAIDMGEPWRSWLLAELAEAATGPESRY